MREYIIFQVLVQVIVHFALVVTLLFRRFGLI